MGWNEHMVVALAQPAVDLDRRTDFLQGIPYIGRGSSLAPVQLGLAVLRRRAVSSATTGRTPGSPSPVVRIYINRRKSISQQLNNSIN
jgi:hypothetical protein